MTEHNMDVMELVENESNARPFQCGWHTCTKSFNRKSDLQRHYRIHTNERPYSCMTTGCGKSFIQRSALTVHIRTHTGEKPHQCQHMTCGKRFSDSSSLARHRRIHTGKRPYKCAHEGCAKSFCRKTTMVKHQRRSHQPGVHSSELEDDDSSDSEGGESPSTPRPSSQIQWPPNMVASSRSVMPPRHIVHRAHSFADFGQQQLDDFSFPQAYTQRHSVSGGVSTYNPSISEHGHRNSLIMARAPSLPPHSSYYVPEQNNPGVATLNTSLPRLQTYHLPRHQRSQEMLQSSPSSYSPGSRASPIVEEQSYYPHRPAQIATYAIHTSPIQDQQGAVQFQQMANHLTQQQYPSASPQDGQWYDNVAYQAPMEAASQIQAYQQAHISPDLWIQKIDTFDDISLQMPSVRVENL